MVQVLDHVLVILQVAVHHRGSGLIAQLVCLAVDQRPVIHLALGEETADFVLHPIGQNLRARPPGMVWSPASLSWARTSCTDRLETSDIFLISGAEKKWGWMSGYLRRDSLTRSR